MNATAPSSIPIKKHNAHPTSVAVLQHIQQKIRELKQQNPTIKHKTAVALVSEEYRKQHNSIRHFKKTNKARSDSNKMRNK
jgi:hypothetical protein